MMPLACLPLSLALAVLSVVEPLAFACRLLRAAALWAIAAFVAALAAAALVTATAAAAAEAATAALDEASAALCSCMHKVCVAVIVWVPRIWKNLAMLAGFFLHHQAV